MIVVTSKENETIKNIKKLKDKKFREKFSKYIIEGLKQVEEAIKNNANIEKIILCQDYFNNIKIDINFQKYLNKYDDNFIIYTDKKVFDMLTDLESPQGIMAVIKIKENNNEIKYNEDLIIILDDIQDPGNLGTIIRTLLSTRTFTNNSFKRYSRFI